MILGPACPGAALKGAAGVFLPVERSLALADLSFGSRLASSAPTARATARPRLRAFARRFSPSRNVVKEGACHDDSEFPGNPTVGTHIGAPGAISGFWRCSSGRYSLVLR